MSLFQRKTLRYYYWLAREFLKKHSKMMLLSFFLSFFVVVALISFSPILNRFLFARKEVIGMVGDYNLYNLPDEILQQISHGLVATNERGEILPALSTSWEIKNNGKQFRFHLKNELLWDDGKKFKAKDLNYNFKDVNIKSVDDSTVDFELTKKLPIFPTYLTKPVLRYPLHGVAGIYKVDRIKTKQGLITEVDLSPNRENLPFIIYKFYDSETKMIGAYKTGAINKMSIYKKNIAGDFLNWRNSKVTKSVDYTRVMTLFFNLNNNLLKEKDVRDAIDQALPDQEIANLGEPARGPIAPTSWAFNPELKQNVENLDVAEKTLQKFTTASSSAKLNFVTFYDYLNLASDLDKNFSKVGLSTNLNLSNFDVANQFDLLLAFWQIPSDPDQYFYWHSTQTQGNITGYKNVKVDKLLEDGRSSLLVSERKKNYLQFQKVIAEDLPAIFLYYPYVYTVERK